MGIGRKLFAGLTSTLLCLAVGVFAADSAAAASNIPGGPLASCSGRHVFDETRHDGSGSMRLEVFYSSDHSGRNCAIAHKGGSLYGKKSWISVQINFWGYDGTSWPKFAEDYSENYTKYAGGAYLNNTNNKCIEASAQYDPADGGEVEFLFTGKIACG